MSTVQEGDRGLAGWREALMKATAPGRIVSSLTITLRVGGDNLMVHLEFGGGISEFPVRIPSAPSGHINNLESWSSQTTPT